jgi:predicted GIY-YIG superfamily endonuclease
VSRTDLYRFFDGDGALLYIGISFSAVARAAQHRKKGWWGNVAKMTVERLDTRQAAEEAELAAIAKERPLHNVVGLPLRSAERAACREFPPGSIPMTMMAKMLGFVSPGRGAMGEPRSIWGASERDAARAERFVTEQLGLQVCDGRVDGDELNDAWDRWMQAEEDRAKPLREKYRQEQIQRIVARDIVSPPCRATTAAGRPCRGRALGNAAGLCHVHAKANAWREEAS